MPVTRALSARQHGSTPQHRLPACGMAADEGSSLALKKRPARQAATTSPYGSPSVKLPTKLLTSTVIGVGIETPKLGRTMSSSEDGSKSYNGSKQTCIESPTNTFRTRSRTNASSTSSSSQIKTHVSDSEPSDGEDEDGEDERFGGCSQSSASGDRDDSNKENIAPFRCASPSDMLREAREAQEEAVARRTRGQTVPSLRRSVSASPAAASSTTSNTPTMRTRRSTRATDVGSFASAATSTRTLRSSSNTEGEHDHSHQQSFPQCSVRHESMLVTTALHALCYVRTMLIHATLHLLKSDRTPRTPTRRARQSFPITPTGSSSFASPATPKAVPQTPTLINSSNGKKRSRPSVESSTEDEHAPTTPISRLRLSPSTPTSHRRRGQTSLVDDDAESYFSSQGSTTTGYSDAASSIFSFAASQEDSRSTTVASRASTPATSAPPSPSGRSHDKLLDQDELDFTHETISVDNVPSYPNVYAHARALLRYSAGVDSADAVDESSPVNAINSGEVKVVGREKERAAFERFLKGRFGLPAASSSDAINVELDGASDSGCLYVCGLPGTGKTALVRSALADLRSDMLAPRVAFVNCMSLSHPRLIFAKVLHALGEPAIAAVADGQLDAEAERRLGQLVREGDHRM